MVRINCHSAFKHYEMFHNSCSGGSNYGSVFNTTYNINCGGHGGGFWGGFGAGLGNAFGNIFGGLFGSVMSNFGFGNFGMGGFGMGGFGMGGLTMPWFNSMGNFGWGGGNAGSIGNTNNNSGSNSSNGVNDKDNALYNTYKKQVDNAIKDNDAKSAKKLYEKIKKSHEKPEDHVYEDMNKGAYHDLMTTLENKFPELKDVADAGKDKKTEKDGEVAQKKPTTDNQKVTDPTVQGTDPNKQTEEAEKAEKAKKAAEEAAKKLKNANSMDDLLGVDYDKLSDADKKNYQNKMRDFVNKMNASDLKAKLANLDDAKRKLVLESIYDGAKNITEENFDQFVKEGATINVIDHSPEMQDFLNAKITSVNNTTITITINTKSGTLTIPYNKDASKYGEMIFHGAKGNTQKYALQIKDNVLYLNQYKYHDGYKEPDIDDKNRDQYKNNTKAKK